MTTRRELANAVRALAMDAVEAANSGHPGMPMGMADIAEVLWNDFLQFNPANPQWANRDRFVLSNGHGSMLQYALLHLTGFDLPIEGQPTKAFKPGDGAVIPPNTPHAGGKNGDKKSHIVSTYIVEKGKPLASPA